jgi:hypothetical protein
VRIVALAHASSTTTLLLAPVSPTQKYSSGPGEPSLTTLTTTVLLEVSPAAKVTVPLSAM